MVCLWLLFLPGMPHAQQVVWTFTAKVIGQTCNVETPPPVNLRTIGLNDLPQVRSTAAAVKVSLKVKDCDPSVTKARFTFIQHPDADMPEYFKADDGVTSASGIAFLLTNSQGQQIRADGKDNTAEAPVTGNEGELDVTIGYVRTSATMKPGVVDGHIEFEVDYP